jgi:hypothetical protein
MSWLESGVVSSEQSEKKEGKERVGLEVELFSPNAYPSVHSNPSS